MLVQHAGAENRLTRKLCKTKLENNKSAYRQLIGLLVMHYLLSLQLPINKPTNYSGIKYIGAISKRAETRSERTRERARFRFLGNLASRTFKMPPRGKQRES